MAEEWIQDAVFPSFAGIFEVDVEIFDLRLQYHVNTLDSYVGCGRLEHGRHIVACTHVQVITFLTLCKASSCGYSGGAIESGYLLGSH